MKKPRGRDPGRPTHAPLSRMMELVGDADRVELKLTVPAAEHRATITGLPLDPVEAEPRQVFFFDTPDLKLSRAGVVVRARRFRGGVADTVVKLRPVLPAELPQEMRQAKSFKVEVDCLPGGFVCSASLKGWARADSVRDVAAGKQSLGTLLSKEQRAFYRKHAPPGVALKDLATLGPTFTLRSVFRPKRLNRKLVAEIWLYPRGARLLELSTKCAPAEAFTVAAQVRAYLTKRGVTISRDRQTKTKMALEYYARELRRSARRSSAGSTRSAGRGRVGATARR